MVSAASAGKLIVRNDRRCELNTVLHLHHRVAPRRLAEPLRADLRRALLRLEVHVDQPEAVAEAIYPLEVVLCAPEEVPIHRYAVCSRTLELREVSAQEHDPVGVVHVAIAGDYVRRAAAVLSDED